jgi:hypothetical protein
MMERSGSNSLGEWIVVGLARRLFEVRIEALELMGTEPESIGCNDREIQELLLDDSVAFKASSGGLDGLFGFIESA